jgi:hypothetical protein
MRSSCCSGYLLRGPQLSRANSSAHAELFSIDMLPVSASVARMSEATSGSRPQAWDRARHQDRRPMRVLGDTARLCSGVRHGSATSGLLSRISLRSSGLLAAHLPRPGQSGWSRHGWHQAGGRRDRRSLFIRATSCEPRRAQPVASLIAVSKLFGSKAGILWIRPRCWVEYQTENASIACGFGASTMSTKS